MSLWGNLDAANNAPKQGATTGYGGNTGLVSPNTQVYFANNQVAAFIANAAIGVFGVDPTEQDVSRSSDSNTRAQHAGWVIRKSGTGPVVTITANNGATGVNSAVVFSGGGTSNTPATATVSVNSTFHIVSVTVTSGGVYEATPTARPNTGNAAFTVTMGGRANRVMTETIVAMGSMTGDGSDDAYFPDA